MRSQKTVIALTVLLLGSALAVVDDIEPTRAGCREGHRATRTRCAHRAPPMRDLSEAPQPTPQWSPRSANAPGGFR